MKSFDTDFETLFRLSNINTSSIHIQKSSVRCRYCKSSRIFFDCSTAASTCENCGNVLERVISSDAEWRHYQNSEDSKHANPTRCGMPIDILLPRSSLATNISSRGGKFSSLVRLHKWNVIHPDERSLFTVFRYMDKIFKNVSVHIQVSSINQAKLYYKILSTKDHCKGTLTRGLIRRSFIAACVLVACKNNNSPIQKIRIAKLCGITPYDITKGYKKFSILEKNKGIQLNKPSGDNIQVHNFIHQFCIRLHFTKTMEDVCHIVSDRLPLLNLLKNKNDTSITAGIMHFVSLEFGRTEGSKQNILKVIFTSMVTVQQVYKVLLKHRCYLLIGLHKFINYRR